MRRLDRVRWLALPLVAYVAITVALPAANGAARRTDFAKHAAFVLGGCVAILAIVALTAVFRRILVEKGPRS